MPDPRWTAVASLMLVLLSGDPAPAKKRAAPQIDSVDDLQIVDCLLPGQVRRLGRRSQYVTARRPIRTAAVDCEIRGGDYVAHDPSSYASALKVWLPAAQAGDPEAQAYVGEIFEKGLAGTPDYESAAGWYRRAAEQGFSRAQINLAHLYEQGLGVPEDREEALRWYRRAAGITEDVVLDSRAEAEALRRELERATAAAAELEEQLAASEQRLEAARSELERSRSEIEELERRLEKARAGSPSAAEVERLETELARRETEVVARSEEIGRQREEVASRRQAFEAFRRQVEEIRRSGGDDAPTIEIVRPDVLATRGPAIVPVPSGTTRLEVTGRVTAPAGLHSLTVDDRQVPASAGGFFHTELVCSETRREVRFVARDLRGRDATATLILEPSPYGAGAPVADTRPTPSERPGARPEGDAGDSSYHALVVNVSSYTHFPDLATAERDAAALAGILADGYGFRVRTLKDPTSLALLIELKTLAEELEPEDHLLIYYAGHGQLEPASQRGYWIPADAERDDPSRWVPNETISDYLDLIPARHVMVVSDSCYSGTMTRSGLARRRSDTPEERPSRAGAPDGRRSRTVLTSGGLRPVLDAGGGGHSLFARALLTVLRLNDEPLPGATLHREVAARVTFSASELGVEQVPRYAPIQFAGHESGDFVLMPKPARSAKALDAAAP